MSLSSATSNQPFSKGIFSSAALFAQQIAPNVLHIQGALFSAIKQPCVRYGPYSLEMYVPEAPLSPSSLEA